MQNIQIPKFRCEFWASIQSGDAVCEISQPGMATRTTDPGYKWQRDGELKGTRQALGGQR